MSTRYARSLFAVPAAVLAAVFGVTSAFAGTTWTVRPGGSISLKSGGLTLKDTTTGAMITCTSAGMSGTLKGGSGLSGTGIGSIIAVGITGCSPAGITFTVTATGLPWHVNFSSYNATNGVVTGRFRHVQVKIKLSAPRCSAVIDGTSGTADDGIVKFTYTNSTAKLKALTTGGNLHFYNVSGCAGLFRNSDPAALSGTFTVSPKQAITSP